MINAGQKPQRLPIFICKQCSGAKEKRYGRFVCPKCDPDPYGTAAVVPLQEKK